jgi:hypothetical protein
MAAHPVRTRQVVVEGGICWKRLYFAVVLSPWKPKIMTNHCAVSSWNVSHQGSAAVAVGAAVESGHPW